jgi:hypothetical protein
MISSAGTAGLDSLTTLCEERSSHFDEDGNPVCRVLERLSSEISGIVEDQGNKLDCYAPGVFDCVHAGNGFIRRDGEQDNAANGRQPRQLEVETNPSKTV